MNDLCRETKVKRGVFFKDTDWMLNVYVIQSNKEENISWKEIYEIIERILHDIERNCISEEFTYFRTGFVFVHYGNRGINLSVWHAGKWGKTYEIFNRAWYCYNREIDKMEILDDAEPVLSQYEIAYLNLELNAIATILKNLSDNTGFRQQYAKYYNVRLKN